MATGLIGPIPFERAMQMTPDTIDGWTYAVAIARGMFDEETWTWRERAE